MKNLSVLCLILFSSVVHASSSESIVKTIKQYLPPGENISAQDCTGPIAARYLSVVHTTQGISIYLNAYSAVGNDNFISFSLGYGGESNHWITVDDFKSSSDELFAKLSNSNTDVMTKSAESDNYVLRIKVLGANTRRIRLENYNSVFNKNVMECTVR